LYPPTFVHHNFDTAGVVITLYFCVDMYFVVVCVFLDRVTCPSPNHCGYVL
jgi:hypothetical protein